MLNASLDVSASSSFTALLELPPTQVVKLLHGDDDTVNLIDFLQILPNDSNLNYNIDHLEERKSVVERKLREKRKKNKVKKKTEKEEEEDNEEEVRIVSRSRKKSKNEESQSQLPYVHVRARRGEATDSHSIAERARREKINARMKLLQELVPGCSKISGLALVLDEIINHVQALQRQVAFLSMQLATVNPKMEFNLDRFTYEENTFVDGSFLSMHPPPEWSDPQGNRFIGFKQAFGQQCQCDPYQQPHFLNEKTHSPKMPDTTNFPNDSSPDTGSMQPRNLKVEQES